MGFFLLFKIPKLEKHKPVPYTTYKHPVELDGIKNNKEANRRRAEVRLVIVPWYYTLVYNSMYVSWIMSHVCW